MTTHGEAVSPVESSYRGWYVLAVYSSLSAIQSLLWLTFSSVPADSREYLGISDTGLDQLLALGPIAYCLSVVPSTALLARKGGLRVSILLGACCLLCAAFLRLIPSLFDPTARSQAGGTHTLTLILVYVAQFINAAAAPLIVASPAVVSRAWFPVHQRNTATAIGNVANAAGRGVGFFLGPALVSAPSDLTRLLLVTACITALPAFAVVVYLPQEPSAGGVDSEKEGGGEGDVVPLLAAEPGEEGVAVVVAAAAPRTLWAALKAEAVDLVAVFRRPSFALVAVACGSGMALWGAWSGVLPSVLSPQYTAVQAGTVGSVATFASIGGGLVAGLATDTPPLRRHLRAVVLTLCLVSGGLFALLACALPPVSAPALALSFPALLALVGLAGAVRGGADPLSFELAARAAAPLSGGEAGGGLTLWYHLLLTFSLLLPAGVMPWASVGMAVVLVGAAGLLGLARVE